MYTIQITNINNNISYIPWTAHQQGVSSLNIQTDLEPQKVKRTQYES